MSMLPNLEQELVVAARRVAGTTRPWRRRGVLLAVSGLMLCAGGATAVARLAQTPSTTGTAIAPVAGPAPVDHLSVAQGQLDALRQPASAATTLPAQIQATIRDVTIAGENPALGRKALTASGHTFWVVPAADGKVCLLQGGGGGGCSPVAQIGDGTFSSLAPCAQGGALHAGLLPNDATDATLALEDGSQRSVTVTNNVWSIQIPLGQPQPTTITWTQNGSQKQAPIGAIPPPAPGQTSTCGP